jgi:hypothetical protein
VEAHDLGKRVGIEVLGSSNDRRIELGLLRLMHGKQRPRPEAVPRTARQDPPRKGQPGYNRIRHPDSMT